MDSHIHVDYEYERYQKMKKSPFLAISAVFLKYLAEPFLKPLSLKGRLEMNFEILSNVTKLPMNYVLSLF